MGQCVAWAVKMRTALTTALDTTDPNPERDDEVKWMMDDDEMKASNAHKPNLNKEINIRT